MAWWRVEVSSPEGTLVAIEPDMLAGKGELTEADMQTIRECARHLLAFAGDGDTVAYSFGVRCKQCGEEYPGAEIFSHSCNQSSGNAQCPEPRMGEPG